LSGSSAPQVLERPGVEHDTAEALSPEPAEAEASEPGRPRRRIAARRLPDPPGRRAPLWFAALVAGALLAAAPSVIGSPAGPQSQALDYGLGAASDLTLSGEIDDAGVRRSITEAEAQARLSELAASRAAREPKTVIPTQGHLSSLFGSRWGRKHYGIDLAAPLGTPIVSATDGVVLEAGRASGYGNAIYIEDTEGYVHVYGHMRYWNVEVGQVVHAGDQIAKVGNEGRSTGPHLHWEVRAGDMNGKPLDPREWLLEHGIDI